MRESSASVPNAGTDGGSSRIRGEKGRGGGGAVRWGVMRWERGGAWVAGRDVGGGIGVRVCHRRVARCFLACV